MSTRRNSTTPPPTQPVDPGSLPVKARGKKRDQDDIEPSPEPLGSGEKHPSTTPEPDLPKPDSDNDEFDENDPDHFCSIVDSFGLSSRVSDPTDVLLNNTSIKKASKELYEKAKIKKTLLQNINDLIDYLKTTDPKIIETIAEAPEQPAKSGIADLTDGEKAITFMDSIKTPPSVDSEMSATDQAFAVIRTSAVPMPGQRSRSQTAHRAEHSQGHVT